MAVFNYKFENARKRLRDLLQQQRPGYNPTAGREASALGTKTRRELLDPFLSGAQYTSDLPVDAMAKQMFGNRSQNLLDLAGKRGSYQGWRTDLGRAFKERGRTFDDEMMRKGLTREWGGLEDQSKFVREMLLTGAESEKEALEKQFAWREKMAERKRQEAKEAQEQQALVNLLTKAPMLLALL